MRRLSTKRRSDSVHSIGGHAASETFGSIGRPSDAVGVEVVCVCLFAALVSFWGLRGGPGLSDHEAIVAVGARSMLQSGDWLIPTVGQEEFLRKPPLPFWLVAAGSRMSDHPAAGPPVSVFAARFPSALAAVLTVFAVFLLARSMFGHRTGVITAAVLSSTAGILFFSHSAQVEMVLTFFSTCAVTCFWHATEGGAGKRVWWPLFYLSLGLAMLAKAPVPLATVVFPLAVWWLVTVPLARLSRDDDACAEGEKSPRFAAFFTQLRRIRRCWVFPGVIVFAIVFVPWPLYVYFTKPGITDLWRIEFLDRYTGELTDPDHSFLYYVPIALGLAFPWSFSLPQAFAAGFLRTFANERKGLLFAFTWVAVQIVFFSSAAFKRPHYLIGTLPGMAILLGPVVERFFFHERATSARKLWLGAIGLVAVFIGGTLSVWRELSHNLSAALPTFRGAITLFFVGCVGCFITYALGRRATSLVLLLGTVAATFAWSWDTMGQQGLVDSRITAMMREIEATSIGPSDRITWVAGRPDTRLTYYLNLNVRPLFTALELAPKRDGRREVPKPLFDEVLTELRKRLAGAQKEYFIVKGRYWDPVETEMAGSVRLVCRAPSGQNDPKDDWVMFTNSWNADWRKSAP